MMSKIQKRFERIMQSPNNTNWDDLCTILQHYGCTIKNGAKHKLVSHPSIMRPLAISVHNNKVKTIYVKKIIALVEQIIEEDE